MGDWRFTIRGKTKLEVWLKLEKLNERTGGYTSPDGKKSSKKSMKFDHEKREWVLNVTVDKARLDGQLDAWLKANGI